MPLYDGYESYLYGGRDESETDRDNADDEDTRCNHCKRYAWKLTIDGFCSERCRNAALEQVYADKEVA